MARCNAARVRLLTRNGHDWSYRFPLIREAVEALRVPDRRRGHRLRGRRRCVLRDAASPAHDRLVTLCAFDLIKIDGRDLRWEPLEHRKAMLAPLLRKPLPGLVFNATFLVKYWLG